MDQSFHQIEDPILTIPEVARYLKIGRNVRIRRTDLQAWMEKQTNQLRFEVLSK